VLNVFNGQSSTPTRKPPFFTILFPASAVLQNVSPAWEYFPNAQISQSSTLAPPTSDDLPAGQSGHRIKIVGALDGGREGASTVG